MKISEHAIDRYIERVKSVSRAKARRKIKRLAQNGSADFEAIERGGIIVTVAPIVSGCRAGYKKTRSDRKPVKIKKYYK